jgi:hypothetical protein
MRISNAPRLRQRQLLTQATITALLAAGTSSVSRASTVSLDPPEFFAVVTAVAGSDNQHPPTSTSGPLIVLNSTATDVARGYLGGEPWYGGVTTANASAKVASESRNGYVSSSIQTVNPTQPNPGIEYVPFGYQQTASASSSGYLWYQLYVTEPTPTVGVLINAPSSLTGSPLTADSLESLFMNNELYGSEGAIINDSLSIYYCNDQLGCASSRVGNSFYSITSTGNAYSLGYTGGFQEDEVYILNTNEIYDVLLRTQISSYSYTATYGENPYPYTEFITGGTITDSEDVDPIYQIAPGTLNADQYAIYLSPGVGSVPEPSTWAMLLLGLASLGCAGYRQSAKSRSIA